eukprot:CAMPEP_0195013720 /NCGR_PEP_ID=MMETSP0326_2-20130528/14087_1 /TAXON_ID=2866 ORGANISM="Crypthecodinium cohnii, Strain Seligo" /NCGR_SAMPLE_ID=MMETSP0326_2 /ASSEMBLY_ACC=CAM_ASM_000348 /LENGTH=88 /DNA_ID=CAMNT_0040024689 /DNA_START=47 /DNA_END=310 /DNA_ORIENTATION=-
MAAKGMEFLLSVTMCILHGMRAQRLGSASYSELPFTTRADWAPDRCSSKKDNMISYYDPQQNNQRSTSRARHVKGAHLAGSYQACEHV